jgi:DNA polymerase-3 subunit delta
MQPNRSNMPDPIRGRRGTCSFGADTVIYHHAFIGKSSFSMKRPAKASAKDKQQTAVHLLFGDELLVKEQTEKIVSSELTKDLRDINLIVMDGAALDTSELSSQVFTPSLFGGNRVVVVENTTVFTGRADKRKTLSKLLTAIRDGKSKPALRLLAQLLDAAGLDRKALTESDAWIKEILGASPDRNEVEALRKVAQEFTDSDVAVGSGTDEDALKEIVTSGLPQGTTLILTATEVDRRKKFFKTVEPFLSVTECAVRQERFGTGLDKSFFEARVKEELERVGKTITPGALEKMHARSGKDMRMLRSEITKLIGYTGDRKKVTESDVDNLFTDFHEAAFFELNNAIRTADLNKCLIALHENLKLVDHPLQTLAMMANDFRKLIIARELLFTVFRPYWKPGLSYDAFKAILPKVREEHPELSSKKDKLNVLAQKEYPIYLLLRDVQKFPMEKLLEIMEAILEADIMMKSTRLGSVSPGIIMERLVMKICEPVRT